MIALQKNLIFFYESSNYGTGFLKEMMSLPSTGVENNQIFFISNNQMDTVMHLVIQGHIRNWELKVVFWQTYRIKMPFGI